LRWIRPEALAVRVAEPAFVPGEEAREPYSRIEFNWVGETARQVGTVAHRWLQRIAEDGLEGWNAARVQGIRPLVESELERRGVPAADRASAADRVVQALHATVSDERGRWILAARPGAANEVRMNVFEEGRVRLVVMDRVFVAEDGARWIVDYKTSRHEGGDVGAFLESERERYAEQLRRYARALGGESRLGLYFPLIPGWREVQG
jgi:ATP-dependent exoDNAse (exonuclease V) beta subunit